MSIADARTIRISGRIAAAALFVGLATGMLFAMATPTAMTRKGQTWREQVGIRDVAVENSTIPVYAPPQDLTPVQWQTAAQEYPPLPDQGASLAAVYPDNDVGYQAQAPDEALPPDVGLSDDLVAADDDAAFSAQAASAAAADVQAEENAVDQSDPATAVGTTGTA